MGLIDKIIDNSLLIIPNNIKNMVIKEITSLDKMYNLKYISFNDIEKRIYSYDKEAVYYLMNKYGYKYNVAITYLENIRYIEDKVYNNNKLNNLVRLRKELLDNSLLYYNNIENYQYDNIIIYGYTYINNFRKDIIKKLEDKYNIIYINDDILDKDNKIYEFNNIKDEIVFVCESICDLINKGIDINKIKLIIEDDSYNKYINNIFSLYNLKTSIKNKTSLDVTLMGKYFLDNIEDDINNTLDKIKNNFDMDNKNNIEVYNKIISVLNKYKDNSIIKYLIEYDFKYTYLDNINYKNEIKVVSIYDNVFMDDEYVFLLGFNQNQIPRINKDEGFFSDKDLKLLGLETSLEKSIYEKEGLIKTIKSINSLVISYKLNDNNGAYLLTTLNDDLGYEVLKDYKKRYSYSNKYNRLELGILIDNLVKYGIHDNSLDKLYTTYSDINYLTYDNKYKMIDKKDLYEYLDNKLTLSYSALSNYYECSFKYYLSNILKIVPYDKTYKSLIGDVFHYILSVCFDKEIDINKEYDKYLEEVDFEIGDKERYFFDKLKEDLVFIIDSIKEQYKYSSFDKSFYEDRVIINRIVNDVEVTFIGFIDKLMYKKYNDKDIVAIIDYKTGNPSINLNNVIYGLDMQLPIYLYLAKNSDSFNNPIIVGFYLQKILNTVVLKDYKNSYTDLKKDNLKLNGYSIDNIELLEEFDNSYNKSNVIKGLSTTKSGEFSHYSKVISEENINRLIEIISNNIDKATDDILNAKFDINPKVINNENKGCNYCMFYDICYRNAKDMVKLKNIDNIFEEVE